MIDLAQRSEPYEIALPYGLTVTVKPLTTAGMAAAPARGLSLRRARPAALMIVDTSALLAIFFGEPEAEDFARASAGAEVSRMSAANLLEAGILADNQTDPRTGRQLDALVANFQLRIAPVTEEQVRIARQAYLDFGRGNHPAGLNFGECFAYALAKAIGEPLLFKGDDFAQTDIRPYRSDS